MIEYINNTMRSIEKFRVIVSYCINVRQKRINKQLLRGYI